MDLALRIAIGVSRACVETIRAVIELAVLGTFIAFIIVAAAGLWGA